MRERVERALDLIRPSLQSDGGDVDLVDLSALLAVYRTTCE